MKRKTFTNLTAGIIGFSFLISLFLNLTVTKDGYSKRFGDKVNIVRKPGIVSGVKNGLCMPGEAFIQSARKAYGGWWRYARAKGERKPWEYSIEYSSSEVKAMKFGRFFRYLLGVFTPIWHAILFLWYLIAFTWNLFFMKASILYYPGFFVSASVFWLSFALSAQETNEAEGSSQ